MTGSAKSGNGRATSTAIPGFASLNPGYEATELPTPAAPSRPAEAAAAAHQTKDEQEHDCADERVQNERKDTRAEMNAELRQQPVADEGADQADDQIADQAEPATAHDPAGEPAGDDADDKNDQKALV